MPHGLRHAMGREDERACGVVSVVDMLVVSRLRSGSARVGVRLLLASGKALSMIFVFFLNTSCVSCKVRAWSCPSLRFEKM